MNQGNLFVIIQRNDISKVARKSLPISLQGQDATGTSLEMKMIRSRSATLRTVIEHHQLAMQAQEPVHLTIILIDRLWLMLSCRNRKVNRQNRERIHQEKEAFIYLF